MHRTNEDEPESPDHHQLYEALRRSHPGEEVSPLDEGEVITRQRELMEQQTQDDMLGRIARRMEGRSEAPEVEAATASGPVEDTGSPLKSAQGGWRLWGGPAASDATSLEVPQAATTTAADTGPRGVGASMPGHPLGDGDAIAIVTSEALQAASKNTKQPATGTGKAAATGSQALAAAAAAAAAAEAAPPPEPQPNWLRRVAGKICNHPDFEMVVILLIFANCITLALYDPLGPKDSGINQHIDTADLVLNALFSAEMVTRIVALGGLMPYLSSYWNVFDMSMVFAGYSVFIPMRDAGSGIVGLRALRALRALRPLRTIARFAALRSLVVCFMEAVPLLIAVGLMMAFFLFIFGVAGTLLFADAYHKVCMDADGQYEKVGFEGPDEYGCGARQCPENYTCVAAPSSTAWQVAGHDHLGLSMLTTFQCITLSSWTLVMYRAMDATSPVACLFYIALVMFGAYFVLNLFLAVLKERFAVAQRLFYDAQKEDRERRKLRRRAVALARLGIPGKAQDELRLLELDDADEEEKRGRNSVQRMYHFVRREIKLYFARRLEQDELTQRLSAAAASASASAANSMKSGTTAQAASGEPSAPGGDKEEAVGPRLSSFYFGAGPSPISAQQGPAAAPPSGAEGTAAEGTAPTTSKEGQQNSEAAGPAPSYHRSNSDNSHVSNTHSAVSIGSSVSGVSGATDLSAASSAFSAATISVTTLVSAEEFDELVKDLPPLTRQCLRAQYRVRILVESKGFLYFFMALILLNTMALGLTWHGQSAEWEAAMGHANTFFTAAFTLELLVKVLGLGLWAYLTDVWNVFDVIVVSTSLAELLLTITSGGHSSLAGLASLRSLRVMKAFRVLRAVKMFKYLESLKTISAVLMTSFHSFAAIGGLLGLFWLVFSIVGLHIFGGAELDPPDDLLNYNSLFNAMVTNFHALNLENFQVTMWAVERGSNYGAVFYTFAWIIMGNYILLTLFLTVILEAFEKRFRVDIARAARRARLVSGMVSRLRASARRIAATWSQGSRNGQSTMSSASSKLSNWLFRRRVSELAGSHDHRPVTGPVAEGKVSQCKQVLQQQTGDSCQRPTAGESWLQGSSWSIRQHILQARRISRSTSGNVVRRPGLHWPAARRLTKGDNGGSPAQALACAAAMAASSTLPPNQVFPCLLGSTNASSSSSSNLHLAALPNQWAGEVADESATEEYSWSEFLDTLSTIYGAPGSKGWRQRCSSSSSSSTDGIALHTQGVPVSSGDCTSAQAQLGQAVAVGEGVEEQGQEPNQPSGSAPARGVSKAYLVPTKPSTNPPANGAREPRSSITRSSRSSVTASLPSSPRVVKSPRVAGALAPRPPSTAPGAAMAGDALQAAAATALAEVAARAAAPDASATAAGAQAGSRAAEEQAGATAAFAGAVAPPAASSTSRPAEAAAVVAEPAAPRGAAPGSSPPLQASVAAHTLPAGTTEATAAAAPDAGGQEGEGAPVTGSSSGSSSATVAAGAAVRFAPRLPAMASSSVGSSSATFELPGKTSAAATAVAGLRTASAPDVWGYSLAAGQAPLQASPRRPRQSTGNLDLTGSGSPMAPTVPLRRGASVTAVALRSALRSAATSLTGGSAGGAGKTSGHHKHITFMVDFEKTTKVWRPRRSALSSATGGNISTTGTKSLAALAAGQQQLRAGPGVTFRGVQQRRTAATAAAITAAAEALAAAADAADKLVSDTGRSELRSSSRSRPSSPRPGISRTPSGSKRDMHSAATKAAPGEPQLRRTTSNTSDGDTSDAPSETSDVALSEGACSNASDGSYTGHDPMSRHSRRMRQFPPLAGTSLGLLSETNRLRRALYAVVTHSRFEDFMLFVIFLDCISMAYDYPGLSPTNLDGKVLTIADAVFCSLFGVEVVLKIIAFGFIPYISRLTNQVDAAVAVGSIIMLVVENLVATVLRSLRMLRVFKALRVVTRSEMMQVVFKSVMLSVAAMANVSLVVLMVMTVFAILGVQLFSGRFHYCTDPKVAGIRECTGSWFDPAQGQEVPREWVNSYWNFDHIGNALVTLFIMATLDGYAEVVSAGMDAPTEVGDQPHHLQNWATFWFFVAYIVVVAYTLLNMYIGVVFFQFSRIRMHTIAGSAFLTPQQQEWSELSRWVLRLRPPDKLPVPKHPWRRRVYFWVRSRKFEVAITALISSNAIAMAVTWYGQSDDVETALEAINKAFTGLYCIETVLKIYGLDWYNYWKNPWNKFDFIVCVSGVVDVILTLSIGNVLNAMQLQKILRLCRIARVVRLVRGLQGVRNMVGALITSLPAFANVIALLFLFFFMYGYMGVLLFGNVVRNKALDEHTNFERFWNAQLTLLRIATADNWADVFMSCMVKPPLCSYEAGNCGTWVAIPYFLTFVVLISMIMLNLFTAVIIENFEKQQEQDKWKLHPSVLEEFVELWAEYDDGFGTIDPLELEDLLLKVKPPLGLGPGATNTDVLRFVYDLDIPLVNGRVPFSRAVYELVRHCSGVEFPEGLLKEQIEQLVARHFRGLTPHHLLNMSVAMTVMRVQRTWRQRMKVVHLKRRKEARAARSMQLPSWEHTVAARMQLLKAAWQARKGGRMRWKPHAAYAEQWEVTRALLSKEREGDDDSDDDDRPVDQL